MNSFENVYYHNNKYNRHFYLRSLRSLLDYGTFFQFLNRLTVLFFKVINEMEDIWFNLNQSREYYKNFTSSLLSLRASVSQFRMHYSHLEQM